ncbi:MAG: glycosyltransferase family 4 protein [Chloroflexi bacterium]|nr:glycosyltransferase family 4 protein [Chloroflexota bacterium]
MAKVLLLTHHFPTPQEAGAGRPWSEAMLLKELGHQVTVLTAGTHYLTGQSTRGRRRGLWSEEPLAGLRLVKTYAPSGFRRSFLRRLLNYFTYSFLALLWGLSHHHDVVFAATDPMPLVPVAVSIAFVRRAKLVLDERDLYPDTAVALGLLKPGLLVNVLDRMQNFARRRAHAIVAATPGIGQLLIEKGIEDRKITVMPNAFPPDGLSTAPVSPSVLNLVEGLGSGFVVLYAGGMGIGNDLMTIVQAAGLLERRGLPVVFLFVGEGEHKREYLAYCEREQISSCRFLEAVPRGAIPLFLQRADVCAHSVKGHPFLRCALSSKVFDYLSYGRPVVFAGEGDMADLLGMSSGGVAVPPESPEALADAIQKLYEDPDLRTRMGQQGASYVRQHFSWEAQRGRLAEALNGTRDAGHG